MDIDEESLTGLGGSGVWGGWVREIFEFAFDAFRAGSVFFGVGVDVCRGD